MSVTPLDRDLVRRLLPGQTDLVDDFIAHDVALSSTFSAETLDGSTGKIICDVTKKYTFLTVSGTKAFTLPDGTDDGQEHVVSCTSAASTPIGTLTVTTPETATGIVCPSTFVFNAAGQMIHFVWFSGKWRVVRTRRAGTLTVVVATDVLTGLNLNALYALSVTGTVNSTGTKALPNGAFAGDTCAIGCSTAATTPHGSIDATVNLASGAAGSSGTGGLGKLADFAATTSNVVLMWNGVAWQVIASIGGIVAS